MEGEAEKDGRGILKGMKVERREGRKREETERGRKRAGERNGSGGRKGTKEDIYKNGREAGIDRRRTLRGTSERTE
jgi:hypothetical protein